MFVMTTASLNFSGNFTIYCFQDEDEASVGNLYFVIHVENICTIFKKTMLETANYTWNNNNNNKYYSLFIFHTASRAIF